METPQFLQPEPWYGCSLRKLTEYKQHSLYVLLILTALLNALYQNKTQEVPMGYRQVCAKSFKGSSAYELIFIAYEMMAYSL